MTSKPRTTGRAAVNCNRGSGWTSCPEDADDQSAAPLDRPPQQPDPHLDIALELVEVFNPLRASWELGLEWLPQLLKRDLIPQGEILLHGGRLHRDGERLPIGLLAQFPDVGGGVPPGRLIPP